MKIEKATKDDIDEIKQLLRITWEATYATFYSPGYIEKVTSEWHSNENLLHQIQDPQTYFAVCRSNHVICGIVTARKMEGNRLMINRIYVLPSFQGQGIGKQLLQSAEKAFSGISREYVEVEELNRNAISFYENQGFRFLDISQEAIGGKLYKVIIMIKELS